jgi:hypothetical protein
MQPATVIGLSEILARHRDERVIVVGGTCTGKSSMIAEFPGARDQDAEIFPLLTKTESDYVCQTPWTPEIGRTMTRLVRERVKAESGRPLFGTVVVDADFIVLLKISDGLLAERAAQRGVNLADAKAMQEQLEEDVRASGVPWTEYSVG